MRKKAVVIVEAFSRVPLNRFLLPNLMKAFSSCRLFKKRGVYKNRKIVSGLLIRNKIVFKKKRQRSLRLQDKRVMPCGVMRSFSGNFMVSFNEQNNFRESPFNVKYYLGDKNNPDCRWIWLSNFFKGHFFESPIYDSLRLMPRSKYIKYGW